MTNINLYQASTASEQKDKKKKAIDSGFFWSLSLFLLVLLSFGGLKIVSKILANKDTVLQNEITQETVNFSGSDLDRITDFQVRSEAAHKNISDKREFDGIFAEIEKSMVKGAALTSFSYENDENVSGIKMNIAANDFHTIAKQIASFKENPRFLNVVAFDISREEDDIKFTVRASFK